MYCPFNICCCWWLCSSWFELIGYLSVRWRHGPVAKLSGVIIFHCSLPHDEKWWISPKDSKRLLYICLSTDIHKQLLTLCPTYISNWNSWSSYVKKLVNHWRILSYLFFTPLCLLVSIALTVTNTFWACLFYFCVGRTNQETFCAALTSCCSGHSCCSMWLLCSISDSSSATQSSSLSFGSSKSPFQFSQFSVSKMHSGAQSSWHWTRWWLIFRIWRTFKIRLCPPGRSFADKAGSKGGLSDNLNAAAPSCWESDQGGVDDHFWIRDESNGCHLLALSAWFLLCSM